MNIQQAMAWAKFVSALANVQSRIYAIRSMRRPPTDGTKTIVVDVNRGTNDDLQQVIDEINRRDDEIRGNGIT